MSISNVFNIGVSGLLAAQKGLDVTSHNIANSNTKNFHKQEINFSDVFNNINSQNVGSGVQVSSIVNVSNTYLEKQMPESKSSSSFYQKMTSLGDDLNNNVSNNITNLNSSIQNLMNTFSNSALSPNDSSIKQNILNKANDFLNQSNKINENLNNISSAITEEKNNTLDMANTDINALAKIMQNKSSSELSSDSDYLSKLYDLSQKIGVQVSNDYQSVYLNNGKPLILNGQLNENITDKDININSNGKLGALTNFQSGLLSDTQKQFNNFIDGFTNSINSQLNNGFDKAGNPGANLFDMTNKVVAITNPDNIAVSSNMNELNGLNANKVADIFNSQKGTLNLISSKLNGSINNNSTLSKVYQQNSQNLESKINNDVGVNLDEEAINTMKYQKWYAANAQVIKTADEMIGTLLNIKG